MKEMTRELKYSTRTYLFNTKEGSREEKREKKT